VSLGASIETPAKYLAPDGQIWVCGACGRNGKDRTRLGDSCFTWAVLCYERVSDSENWCAVPDAVIENDSEPTKGT
jgi:hypothetical protein